MTMPAFHGEAIEPTREITAKEAEKVRCLQGLTLTCPQGQAVGGVLGLFDLTLDR